MKCRVVESALIELESHTTKYDIENNDIIDSITKTNHLDCDFSGYLETLEIVSECARPGS